MGKRITMIQGHPDGQTRHFCHALADEYAKGCADGGHEVRRIEVARLEFPLLRTKEEFERGLPPDSIALAQDAVRWADHLVIVYPLWLGSMPALLTRTIHDRPLRRPILSPGGAVLVLPPGRLTGSAARTDVALFGHRAVRPRRTAGTPASASRARSPGRLRSHTPRKGIHE